MAQMNYLKQMIQTNSAFDTCKWFLFLFLFRDLSMCCRAHNSQFTIQSYVTVIHTWIRFALLLYIAILNAVYVKYVLLLLTKDMTTAKATVTAAVSNSISDRRRIKNLCRCLVISC